MIMTITHSFSQVCLLLLVFTSVIPHLASGSQIGSFELQISEATTSPSLIVFNNDRHYCGETDESAEATTLRLFLDEFPEFGITYDDLELYNFYYDPNHNNWIVKSYHQMFHSNASSRPLRVIGANLKVVWDIDDCIVSVAGVTVPKYYIDYPQASFPVSSSSAVLIAQENIRSRLMKLGFNNFESNSIAPPLNNLTIDCTSIPVLFPTGLSDGVLGKIYFAEEVSCSCDIAATDIIYVDVYKGTVIQILTTEYDHAMELNRRVWWYLDRSSQELLWSEGDGIDDPDEIVKVLLEATKNVYQMLWNMGGVDSWNAHGGNFIALINMPGRWASWNRRQIKLCNDAVVPDVIGHEWGHAYTDGLDQLIYANQSGALNEGWSDIMGEVLQLLYYRNQDHVIREDEKCSANDDSSSRWLIGEYFVNSAIRDMFVPECFNDPASIEDAGCSSKDHGMVHSNNGIANRVFALLADGSEDLSIRGIGILKAFHIHLRSKMAYQTEATTFRMYGTYLRASCSDLAHGSNMAEADVSFVQLRNHRGEKLDSITQNDCVVLDNVLSATGFDGPWPCNMADAASSSGGIPLVNLMMLLILL